MDSFKIQEKQDKAYYEESLSPVLMDLIALALQDKPKDVVWIRKIFQKFIRSLPQIGFIVNHLKSKYKIKSIGDLSPHEREELNELRSQVKELRQNRGQAFEVGSQAETESDEDEDDVEDLPEAAAPKVAKKGPRTSVSAQAFGMWNKKSDFKPPSYPKNEEQKQKILNRLGQAFMFSMLDEQQKHILVDAMQVVTFKANDVVIKEGDDGDNLYVVQQGSLKCTKVFVSQTQITLMNEQKKGDQPTHLKDYQPGQAFGQLALLYNAPRAATITSLTDCVLISLDRATFNHIVKDAAMKKRERYEEFLKNVKILSGMDSYERSKLADAVKAEQYKNGDYIIKEGDSGNIFYFIEEGKAIATKVIDGTEKEVKSYQPGEYFGELALLRNEPRAANIIAKSDVTVLSLDRHSFKRLLGPLEDILKRNMDIYKQYAM